MISFPGSHSAGSDREQPDGLSVPTLAQASWDRIAELVRAQQPLESGLKVVAEELPAGRSRRELLRFARELERGKSPLELSAASGTSGELQELVKAGVETGQLGALLQDYVEDALQAQELRWQIRFFSFYSLALITVALCVNAFVLTLLNDMALKFTNNFELKTPAPHLTSTLVFWGVWSAACLPLVLAVTGWVLSKILPVRAWSVFYHIPLLGGVFRWQGFARGCRILALLLQASCPLPRGMSIVGKSVRQPLAAHAFRSLGTMIEHGKPLEDAALAVTTLPPSLREVFTQAREGETLREILREVADLYARRARELMRWFLFFWEPGILLSCAAFVLIAYMIIMYNVSLLLRQIM